LTINLIWNPSDIGLVGPILNLMLKTFSRDQDKPFSRSLNITMFYFSSSNGNEIPSDYPLPLADKSISFVFTSEHTLGNKKWKKYVEGVPSNQMQPIVPIALSNYGLNHLGSLSGLNCIRAFEWPVNNRNLIATVFLAHEIYRHGFTAGISGDVGSDSSIKLFLSHSKSESTGPLYSKKVKDFIDNTNMKHFFDATEIAPGFLFYEEIEKHIKTSTLLAFGCDTYSSRYWCQREILSAKQNNRPVVAVDCRIGYEDRIFPAASNIPCVHVATSNELSDTDVLRILSFAIIETIRFEFALNSLKTYQQENWISGGCKLIARPPEIRQFLKRNKTNFDSVCYPEPPIFSEEADWHAMAGIEAYTPLWNISQQDELMGVNLGISISDIQSGDFSNIHTHPDQLIRLAQDFARHTLARSATLIFGGDLRKNGFTEFILEEAIILKNRLRDQTVHIQNHLAWPLHLEKKELTAWRAKYSQIMDTVEHPIPYEVSAGISSDVFLPPTSTENSYIWSRSLTEMRKNSIAASSVRVCAGGKAQGYKGKMPGVLEEIMIALKSKTPILLLGGCGGIVGDVCQAILEKNVPASLTQDWQMSNNVGYSKLQKMASVQGHACDYEGLVSIIHSIDLSELSASVCLSKEEYQTLMVTPFVDECLHITLKGLRGLRHS